MKNPAYDETIPGGGLGSNASGGGDDGKGTVLAGRYRRLRRLGGGGMGEVYLVEDMELRNRRFAVKMIPSILVANDRAYEQIKNEALVSLNLVHPNIVQVRAVEKNDGDPFIVMDYVEGESLADIIARKGHLSEAEALKILRPVAAALDYAHSRKIIHRDIKPSNIMVAKDGTPVVLDFGIAREIKETMTRVTGSFSSGTLLYMSPEQLDGEKPSRMQDVYSFAATAYECLAGEAPFARGDIAGQIRTKSPRALPKGVSIAPGIMAGLAKSPAKRPVSCAAVLSGKTARKSGIGAFFKFAAMLAVVASGAYLGKMKYDEAMAERETKARQAEEAQKRAEEEKQRLEDEKKREREAQEKRQEEEKKRLEEEKKRLEDEKKRLEEERKRIQPPAAGDSDEDLAAQEARQKEVQELLNLWAGIRIKSEDASKKFESLSEFRRDPEGLHRHIATADAKWQEIEAVDKKPSLLADAKAAFKIVSDAETAIALELDWLKRNKADRDEARKIEAEIKKGIEPELAKFKAADYARTTHSAGVKLRTAGNEALGEGDFSTAKEKLTEAKAKLSEAAGIARKFCIDTHLKLAKTYFDASSWQSCIDEANIVLGWDAANAEAQEYKRRAEEKFIPSARLVAKVDGREVEASATIGGKNYKTPVPWNNLKKGNTIGPAEIEYEEGNARYIGSLPATRVDWVGPKVFAVALKKVVGPKHGEVRTITLPGGAKMEMIYCAPGEFTMGSPADEPGRENDETRHSVRLTKGFWLGKYEVTQAQWQSVMGNYSNPSSFMDLYKPVDSVSWFDCQKFIEKINEAGTGLGKARLPTEAEWEYACRAGSTGPYNGRLGDVAWYDDNSGGKTHPVGQKQSNAWGFYDMHGNVWEWCGDRYGKYPSGLVVDPVGSDSGSGRVLRGGSWDYIAVHCRSAKRNGIIPSGGCGDIGFRLCCSAGL